MKKRYIFTKDADISPMGYAQTAPANLRKHFKKGDVVWGEVYPNAVRGESSGGSTPSENQSTQGYALRVEKEGATDISEGWDVPLPPLGDSPVEPYPLVTVGRVIVGVVILGGIYGILKFTKIIK